jgi:hypothetical protein
MTRGQAVCVAGCVLATSMLLTSAPAARAQTAGSCSWEVAESYVATPGAGIVWTSTEGCNFSLRSLTISSAIYNGGSVIARNQPLETNGSTGACSAGCETAASGGALPIVVPESEHVLITKFAAVDRTGWSVPGGNAACHMSGAGGTTLACALTYTFYADPAGLTVPGAPAIAQITDSAQLVIQTAGLN